MSNFVVCDIETNIKVMYKRKAHFLHNGIVAACFKHQDEEARVYYKEEDWNAVLEKELSKTKTMVAFNAKFECLYFWKYPAFQRWVADGGRIFDPQMAHYMIRGQRETYPSLRKIAVEFYGCDYRNKVMEPYWEKEIDTADIPKDLVINDVIKDVWDTEKVMLEQIRIMKKEGMFILGNELMESILATTEMEYNGIYIEQKIMQDNQALLEVEIEELRKQVLEIGNKYCQFDPSSAAQVSKLFFGQTVKTKIDVPVLNELGQPILIKSGEKRGQVRTKKQDSSIYEPGMGLIPDEKWKTKIPGRYSTDDLVLHAIQNTYLVNDLRQAHEDAQDVSRLMLQVREKEKMMNTYYEGFKKYLDLITSLIHGNINHAVTGTGRTSSSAPNLQNLSN